MVVLILAEALAHLALPAGQKALFAPFADDRSAYLQEGGGESNLPWFVPGALGSTGEASLRINALGLRDARNYPAKKAKGCFRVLAVGDSRTFGLGVDEPESWPGALETALLSAFPSACIEVLNAGMPDTDLHDQVALFVERWQELEPDLVLVGLSAPDDIQGGASDAPPRSRARSLVMEQPWLAHSSVVRWFLDSAVRDELKAILRPALPPVSAPGNSAWDRFEGAVADLRNAADRAGARLAVVLLPVPVAEAQHPVSETHRHLSAWFESEWHLPSLDLVPALADLTESELRAHAAEPWPSPASHGAYARQIQNGLPWGRFLQRCPEGAEMRVDGRVQSCVDSDGLRHGQHREVGVDGATLLDSTYRTGTLSGPFRRLEMGGRALEEGNYLEGVKDGPWWEVKQPTQEMRDVARGHYRMGLRQGLWVETSIRGSEELRREGLYLDGRRHGQWVVANHIEGRWRVAGEGNYSAGQRSGRWLRWQPEGEGRSVLERILCYVGPGEVLIWEWTAFEVDAEGLPGDLSAANGGAGESNCADGIDDEGDGRVDCEDPDCLRDPACAHLLQNELPAVSESDCGNAIDDDKDGATDCVDEDCLSDAACAHLTGLIEGNCSDGRDGSDRDGLSDCADPDCRDDPACAHLRRPVEQTGPESAPSADTSQSLAVEASEAVLPETGYVRLRGETESLLRKVTGEQALARSCP